MCVVFYQKNKKKSERKQQTTERRKIKFNKKRIPTNERKEKTENMKKKGYYDQNPLFYTVFRFIFSSSDRILLYELLKDYDSNKGLE